MWARQMRLEGVPVLAISRATGFNPSTLTAYLRRHGIPVPAPVEAPSDLARPPTAKLTERWQPVAGAGDAQGTVCVATARGARL
jgi:hypothetical protein